MSRRTPTLFRIRTSPWLIWLVFAVSCRASLQAPEVEYRNTPESLQVSIRLDPTGSLNFQLRQMEGPSEEVEISLYAVRETPAGRIEVPRGEIRRQELHTGQRHRTLKLPVFFEEPMRLALEALDPINGYPLADVTYLPPAPAENPLLPDMEWSSRWDRRSRALGIWLLCHEQPLRCEISIDEAKLEGFLRH